MATARIPMARTPSTASRRSAPSLVHPTTIVEPARLSGHLGIDIVIASEGFQRTGSFKFRAAYQVAVNVPHAEVLTASSGNFGQALALACQLLDKRAIVVMPSTAAEIKVAAVRAYGAQVDLIDTRVVSRAARVNELAAAHPLAYVASAYDDPLVIAGNSSLGHELAERLPAHVDTVVVPIGGGGLAAGLITGLRQMGRALTVIGAEPALANDAARSLRAAEIVVNDHEPETIADGARTISLGQHNWPILQSGLASIVEVSEAAIVQATRLLFLFANMKAEPTGALSLAALLTSPERFRNAHVCCVVSGANVDWPVYSQLLGVSTAAPGSNPRTAANAS